MTVRRAPSTPEEAAESRLPRSSPSLRDRVPERVSEEISEATRAALLARKDEQPAPAGLLDFTKAKEFLKTHGIHLEAKRTARVRDALRWGETTKREADKFGAAFDSAEVSLADLKTLVGRIQAEPALEQRVILGIDDRPLEMAFNTRIGWAGIPFYRDREPSNYQRVDLKTGKPLEDQRTTGKAGITFLPSMLNPRREPDSLSPKDQLATMKDGTKYLGPHGWLIYFRQCLDEGMSAIYPEENIYELDEEAYSQLVKSAIRNRKIDKYLPDTETGTQFLNLRRKGGRQVPYVYFHTDKDFFGVNLHEGPFATPVEGCGGREVLGTFLA